MSPHDVCRRIRALWDDACQVDRWSRIYEHLRNAHNRCYRFYEWMCGRESERENESNYFWRWEIFPLSWWCLSAQVILIKWSLTDDWEYQLNSDWRVCAHLTFVNSCYGMKWNLYVKICNHKEREQEVLTRVTLLGKENLNLVGVVKKRK